MGHTPSPYSHIRFAELVKKIETSGPNHRKRVKHMQRRINASFKELGRIAKKHGLYAACITLTYNDDRAHDQRHISRFVTCLRKKLKRLGHPCLYIWTFERTGKLHYHVLLWLPHGMKLSSRLLGSWWTWGATWVASCRNAHNWKRYIAKAASKDALPSSVRIFAIGGLDAGGKIAVTMAVLPRWLRNILPKGAVPRRRTGGGWIDLDTGVVYESPWCWTPHGPRLKSRCV